MAKSKRKMGWYHGARLDVETSRDMDIFAAKILAEECGLEHNIGVRDDLCPKCIKFKKQQEHQADWKLPNGRD